MSKEVRADVEIEQPRRKMRILWHSVAPYVRSGYGTVTRYFCQELLNHEYQVLVSAFYGLDVPGYLNYSGIVTLPIKKSPSDLLGFESTATHYRKLQCNLGVFHADFWVSLAFPRLIENSLLYSPLDHEDYPEEVLNIIRSYKWIAVPSRHAKEELEKYGIKSTFVPHGVDTQVYRPLDKQMCRKKWKLEDEFIIGIVAANNDREPRKGWDANFQAIKMFLDNNPDAQKDTKVFIHTNPEDDKGIHLGRLAKHVGIEKHIIWDDPYLTGLIGRNQMEMAEIYNAFDVFLLLSRREGFCLPALEAQACGVPCILTGFSAMIERNNYGRCGWLVKPAAYVLSAIGGKTSIPDPAAGADALAEAYNKTEKREHYAKRALEYAKTQTWQIAIQQHMIPLLNEIADQIPETAERKEPERIAGN